MTDSFCAVWGTAKPPCALCTSTDTEDLSMNIKASIGLAVLTAALPKLVYAQEPTAEPAGTVAQEAATTGATELDGQGQFAAADIDAAEAEDATEWDVAGGGLASTGNARALSLTGATNFRLRRKRHQFGAAFAGNYGRAAVDGFSDPETTVGNAQGRLRYDYFVHPRVSLFAMATARHDPFQGLDLRLNVDPGAAFYILKDAKHRLWTEAGYDFQYDIRTDEALEEKDEEGNVVLGTDGEPNIIGDKTRINHAVRMFGGYANNLNEHVSFNTGLEYLQSVLEAKRWRINYDVGLSANLIGNLAINTTFTVRVDNDPAPGIRKVDTITAFSLLYRFF